MSNTCDNITLTALEEPSACQQNPSGVKVVYTCPRKDVLAINAKRPTSMTSLEDKVTIGSATLTGLAITCATGKGFVRIYSAQDMGELKYTQTGEILGCRSFKGSLEVYHPGFNRKSIGFMSLINNQEQVLVVLLNNGEYHLLGDEERGAVLASGNEMTSGKASSDNNGINPVFEYGPADPMIFWDGFDPKDTTKGIPIIGEEEVDPDDNEQGPGEE